MPTLEPQFAYLYEIFRALDATRGIGFNGRERLTYAEVLAYSTLLRFPFDPWEVEALFAMDEVACAALSGG